ncbi:MAG: DUF2062 domain-containing protein [Paracoccaceae bacterium]
MFKRRNKRSYTRTVVEGIYPKGGWARAFSYMFHRLRRLPDPPHKIARGIGVGVMVCFTPFYGMHFLLAATFAILLQGNILAAILATFFGNPITFPIIALLSVDLGAWMLGQSGGLSLPSIVGAFSYASLEIWANLVAIFTDDVANWDRLDWFFRRVFWPYLVGGILPGIFCGLVAYAISHRLIAAYQKSRIKRLKKRYEKRREIEAARASLNVKTEQAGE